MSINSYFFSLIRVLLITIALDPVSLLGSDIPTQKYLLLFVHGFGGNSSETWKAHGSTESWIQMIGSDIEMSSFTAKSFDYPSGCYETRFIIPELSKPLIQDIFQASEKFTEIYIVAHSMGGLLTMSALGDIYRDDPRVFNKIKAVILCGVPFHGIDKKIWLNMFRLFCKSKHLHELDYGKNESYLTAMEDMWRSITHVKGMQYPRIYNFYEEKYDLGIPPIANKKNTYQHSFDFSMVIGKNHRALVKPEDKNDSIYKYAKRAIQETNVAVRAEKEKDETIIKRIQEENISKIANIKPVRKGIPPVKIYTEEPYGQYKCLEYELFDLIETVGSKMKFSNEQSSPVIKIKFILDSVNGSIVIPIDDLQFDDGNPKASFEQRLDFLRFKKALALESRMVFWDIRQQEILFRAKSFKNHQVYYNWRSAEREISILRKVVHIERKFMKRFSLKPLDQDTIEKINYISAVLKNSKINLGNEYVQLLQYDEEDGPSSFKSFQGVNYNGIAYQMTGDKDKQTIFNEKLDLGPWTINIPSATANAGTCQIAEGKFTSCLSIKTEDPKDKLVLFHNIFFERNEVDEEPRRTPIDVIRDMYYPHGK